MIMYSRFAIVVAAMLSVLFTSAGLLAQSSDDISAQYQRSYDSEALGQYQVALDALAEMPRLEHDTFIYQLRSGWLFYLLGRYESSIESYERAIELAPDAIESRLGLLLPQMALRLWLDAQQTAESILVVDPLNYLARRRLALILFSLGRYDEAEQLYRAVFEQYPSDVEVLSGLAWSLLRQSDEESAAELFGQVLHVSPNQSSAMEGLREISAGH